MWGADTRERAQNAFERFLATWEAKYPRAAECLARDREELLAFYDFMAAHWQSLRTTNPIESTFATIRLRTAKTRNCLSEKTALSLVHQLAMSAQKRWRRLRGFRHLPRRLGEATPLAGRSRPARLGLGPQTHRIR